MLICQRGTKVMKNPSHFGTFVFLWLCCSVMAPPAVSARPLTGVKVETPAAETAPAVEKTRPPVVETELPPATEAPPAPTVETAPPPVMKAPPAVTEDASDPFHRRFTFFNQLDVPIYPVIQSPNDSNCTTVDPAKFPKGSLLRIIVNADTKGAGIPGKGGTAT